MTSSIPLPIIHNLKLLPTDGHRLLVYFPYHPDNVARIKTCLLYTSDAADE